MKCIDQRIEDNYAIYNGDSCDLLKEIPDDSIHLTIYSPPFPTNAGGLYHYSSSPRDLSNCKDKDEFFKHYEFIVSQIKRITLPGRCTAVHCADTPTSNSGNDFRYDFPGDVIRIHEHFGFGYVARHCIWKEPLGVRNRTMAKNLAHKTIVDDAAMCGVASADYLLIFRKRGENKIPVSNKNGLDHYAGERQIPDELLKFKGYSGKQTENRFSHWIWRQYASSFWDDIRIGNVLPFREAKDEEDEKHVHPLQLDVIDRVVNLRSNKGEVVLTPFMGVGSEVYQSVINGRKGIGFELKSSYFRQAIKNMESIGIKEQSQLELF